MRGVRGVRGAMFDTREPDAARAGRARAVRRCASPPQTGVPSDTATSRRIHCLLLFSLRFPVRPMPTPTPPHHARKSRFAAPERARGVTAARRGRAVHAFR
ncbi:hypothetical protein WS71_00735 [Burkholderia mayonis]|uniref:Uncharacterized protein n=1 Tax=Burkholderia mayonis TaxID=1385591 RepID=A0A1B4FQR6_9BURK|nr:hypothetical protein WS71_00735 [Burkholderia mayonis]KVE56922.1 hypothetical protein WS71_02510 [Burkholderia mayonis]